jgi:alkylation response protein AidB-like acyl-CoA dehydrogenase
MGTHEHYFLKTTRQKDLYEMVSKLADSFKDRSEQHDREGSFPFENMEELKKSGYTRLSLPKDMGGEGISLYELVLLQERLAQGDASTALSIGWHMGIVMDTAEKKSWKKGAFEKIAEEIVQKGTLLNSAVSEAATGSPTRGGRPQTLAVKEGEHWVINGRKTFTTMAPVLDYFIVVAAVENNGEIAQFIVPRETKGLEIVETWDTMAMRGTGSHDVVLTNVKVPLDALVQVLDQDSKKKANGWLLHIPACYMGIALAARNYAVDYANSYKPNSISGPISELPNIRQLIGEMELELMSARTFLYSTAQRWDEDPENRYELHAELAAVKHVVTNAALRIVDKAMRIVGAQSLYHKNPLQRYYRDVRAGLHNPPMDDAVVSLLAQRAINEK